MITLSTIVPTVHALSTGFPYETQKIRGVNLGGWLVLERWLKPSLFEATGNPSLVDEWSFCESQDWEKATQALKHHWDTWITEADFREMAAAGLNHVRLPIGYWAFETAPGEPYISGQLPYLEKAVEWAGKHNIKVIIDLHGAPGSQNGFDNSGHKQNAPEWHTSQSYIDRTNAIIRRIAIMFRNRTGVVTAIAPLNEPAGFYSQDVVEVSKQYWKTSYESIRQSKSKAVTIIHDAFQPLENWNGFMTGPGYEGSMLDTHIYQLYSVAQNRYSEAEHIAEACDSRNRLQSKDHLPVVVGEWSVAPNDCVNRQLGYRSMYDGSYPGSTRVGSCEGLSGDSKTFSSSYKTFLRKYWEAQTMSYEKGQGWIMWTWKTETADEWSYKAGLAGGWIPRNPTDYKYPRICG